MQSHTSNSDVERYPRRQPQNNLAWAEEALVSIARVDSALNDPHTIPHNMASYGPQPSGATPVDQTFQTSELTAWLLQDLTPGEWQPPIQQPKSSIGSQYGPIHQSEFSIMGRYGPEYGQSNAFPFHDFANQSAAVDSFSYVPNSDAWPTLKSNSTPPTTSAVLPSVTATGNSSPESSVFDQYYTPGSMETPTGTSPCTTLDKTPSPPSETILPSTDKDRYLAAVGLAALPLINDKKTSLSGAQDHTTENFQWYGVEPTQRPSDGDNQNGGPTSYTQTKIVVQPVTRVPPTKEERDYNDRVLVEGKQRGETYKEIRAKFIGECPAESTLRGRYRVLTKAINDRVRKPVWTKTDVILLRRHVSEEFERINAQFQHAESLSISQKLAKISWKRVADCIKANGGTYQFGVTTCKKKWIELNALSSAPKAAVNAKSATRSQRYA
ncbi:hypothetical protein yc1106_09759 [Curvularia clavata]|uniref:Myb-like domain-containing protein n=1 Tax=Curvularia clavata TaxID=95742 RepID=A0A9Q8ZHV6_CURCL|nr:hypothetical protein yc1106_09759 [Curvularia clavata]